MSKKTKKGPHPHDKKGQQQIAGCPRCRGKEIATPLAQETEPTTPPADTSGLAPRAQNHRPGVTLVSTHRSPRQFPLHPWSLTLDIDRNLLYRIEL
jgi:hypothetical protein